MKKVGMMVMGFLLLVGCGGGGGGGGDPEDNCVEALEGCDAPTCVGQYVRTCSADKTEYEYEYCFNQVCQDGVCQNAACTTPGEATCEDASTVNKCLENMTQTTKLNCSAETVCAAGACLPVPCTAGEKKCAWQAVVECTEDGQAWQATACGDLEYCDEAGPVCVPMHPYCIDNPLGSFCDGLTTARQCSNLGKAEPTECGDDEVCQQGFCQPRACGVTYTAPGADTTVATDTSGGDSSGTPDNVGGDDVIELAPQPDIPPLEPVAKAEVTINGGDFYNEKVKFTSNKTANYVHKDKTLQVKMGKGTYIMEIQFQNIEEGVVGMFTSEDPGSVAVTILFNDGSQAGRELQWRYTSASYEATLEEFGLPNEGRAKGTFSGVLADQAGGPELVLTDGSFNVPRKE